jgi:molybdopterin synthase catalytic subunit
MRVRILFFASLKERAGMESADIDLPDGARVSDLKARVVEVLPGLRGVINTSVVSINQNFAFDEDLVPDGVEAAIFPPVSGGGSGPVICQITEGVLDIDDLVAQITLPTTGAACIFSGMVRGQTSRGEAHETTFLDYEAYVPMAEAKMRQVADEIHARWDAVEGIAIVQRIGRLLPGTPTVMIACTASHRDTGVFEAARYGIDRLKEIVPVWKKEVGPDGETWIEGKYHRHKGD